MAELSVLHWFGLALLFAVLDLLIVVYFARRFVSRCLGIMVVMDSFMTPCEIVSIYRANYRSIVSHDFHQTFLTFIALPNLEQSADVIGTDNTRYPCNCERMYRPSQAMIDEAWKREEEDRKAEEARAARGVFVPGPLPA